MQLDKNKIHNILVVRNDRFGEFLLNIAAIRALRETFPNAKITLVVSQAVNEIAKNLRYIDDVLVWDMGYKHRFWEKLALIKTLKNRHFDLAIMLNPSKAFNFFTFFAGIPVRVGYNRKCGYLLTHKIKDRKHLALKHEVEYNLELIGLVGAQTQDKSVHIEVRPQDETEVSVLLKKYGIGDFDTIVVLHPWTSDSIKQWPMEHFKELAKSIAALSRIKVIVIGGKEEEIRSGGFCFDIHGLVNLTGKMTLLQSAALLKRAKLLISNDSGPVHLAAAVDVPVIVLFRNDIAGKSARRWGPWGKGHIVIEKMRLADISVDEVFDKAKDVLGV